MKQLLEEMKDSKREVSTMVRTFSWLLFINDLFLNPLTPKSAMWYNMPLYVRYMLFFSYQI